MTDKTDSKERAEFEAHMRKLNACTRLERQSEAVGGNYRTISVQRAWELWQAARASLAASAGSEPVAADGWLHENGLLYRLTDERHPRNRDEINVTMADGSRSIESRSRRALELLDRIRATHFSPPEGMVGGWMPMADAPRDGTLILAAIYIHSSDGTSEWQRHCLRAT